MNETPNGNGTPRSAKGSATREEEMLAALLGANQTLTDAIKMRDDWQRAAIAAREERQVEERSRYDTRMDRSVSPSLIEIIINCLTFHGSIAIICRLGWLSLCS